MVKKAGRRKVTILSWHALVCLAGRENEHKMFDNILKIENQKHVPNSKVVGQYELGKV